MAPRKKSSSPETPPTAAPAPVAAAAASPSPAAIRRKIRRIAILTGGGDCPGLNAVIRAVAKTCIFDHDVKVHGIIDGFHGLIFRNCVELQARDVSGILSQGGTILGSSNKDNPFDHIMKIDGKEARIDVSSGCIDYIQQMGWDALVCIGGDGTQSMAQRLFEKGVPIVGVPKTIDNDLEATDVTFGYRTAVDTATDAIDKLRTTAMAHHRVQIVEMMGRYAGWLTLESGVAGGADIILIPEIEFDMETVCDLCLDRSRHGKRFTIIAVSEGAKPKGGQMVVARLLKDSPDPIRLGGVGQVIANAVTERTGLEARATVLGHLQRGGSPCSFDRILATRFGHHAAKMIIAGEFGMMSALRGRDIVGVRLQDAIARLKLVSPTDPLVIAARDIGTSFGDRAEG